MKADKLMEISDYSLFVPRGKQSLIQDYPELKKHAYLSTLRKDKLLFCWYLGCEGSPCYEYYNSDSSKMFEQALKFARKKSGLRVTDEEFKDYIENSFLPTDLKKAIEIFSNFKLGVRIRLKKMIESMLNNLEKVINVDINSDEFNVITKEGINTKERDYAKVKAYTDISINIRKSFSDILDQAEQGFGVSEVEEEERFEVGQSFLDLKHEQNK